MQRKNDMMVRTIEQIKNDNVEAIKEYKHHFKWSVINGLLYFAAWVFYFWLNNWQASIVFWNPFYWLGSGFLGFVCVSHLVMAIRWKRKIA